MDTVPLAYGVLPEPAAGVHPIGSAGGFVQGLDHGQVGLVAIWPPALFDAFQPSVEIGCPGGAESRVAVKSEFVQFLQLQQICRNRARQLVRIRGTDQSVWERFPSCPGIVPVSSVRI